MEKQPNFLFVFPDQWRWDFLGCDDSGVPVRTPNVDALAQRGVRFTECRTNSPLCAPARAALAQGVRFHRCGVPNNGVDTAADAHTFFQELRNAGYRVATCGKNDLHKRTTWKGRDGWTQLLGRYGFTEAIDQSGKLDAANHGTVEKGGPHCSYTSYLHSHGQFEVYRDDYARRRDERTYSTAEWPTPLDEKHYTDEFCGRMGMKLLEQFPLDGPWMLWVNFPGPHDPFDPPRRWQSWYDGVDFDPPAHGQDEFLDKPVDHQQLRRNYAACCEGIDAWLGRYLDAIEQRGELDNTIVVFASDHGEMLGDHGRFGKASHHEGSVHVPLVVAGPGVREGAESAALVELIDLAATFLDLAGLEVPSDFDAKSFCPILTSDAADATHRDLQIMGLEAPNRNAWHTAFDGRFKLLREIEENGQICEQLFDLAESWKNEAASNDVSKQFAQEAKTLSQRLTEALAS